mmetsp:Transcript_33855/g.93646  ORF Transcript_33855/g.93646 Transcript_33855/m.93646 type:complete len:242 (+) Transcript_33855:43-768(+)
MKRRATKDSTRLPTSLLLPCLLRLFLCLLRSCLGSSLCSCSLRRTHLHHGTKSLGPSLGFLPGNIADSCLVLHAQALELLLRQRHQVAALVVRPCLGIVEHMESLHDKVPVYSHIRINEVLRKSPILFDLVLILPREEGLPDVLLRQRSELCLIEAEDGKVRRLHSALPPGNRVVVRHLGYRQSANLPAKVLEDQRLRLRFHRLLLLWRLGRLRRGLRRRRGRLLRCGGGRGWFALGRHVG